MNLKTIHLFLILSSLLGYLEWGTSNKQFLIELEGTVILKLFSQPKSVLHPLILLPLVGQVLLLWNLFQKNVKTHLMLIGTGAIASLYGILFVIGILNLNMKILLSSLPFLFFASFGMYTLWKQKHLRRIKDH